MRKYDNFMWRDENEQYIGKIEDVKRGTERQIQGAYLRGKEDLANVLAQK